MAASHSSSGSEHQKNKATLTGENSTLKQTNEYRKESFNFNLKMPGKTNVKFNFPRPSFFAMASFFRLAATFYSMGYLSKQHEMQLKANLREAAGLYKPKNKTNGQGKEVKEVVNENENK